MITEIMLVLMILAVLLGVMHLINLLKARKLLEKHDEVHTLFIIATVFFIVSIAVFGVYTLLGTPYGIYLAGVPPTLVLGAYALFVLPLSVLALLAALFSMD